MLDLASDTNYITHQVAEKLGLTGEPVLIALHGVKTFKEIIQTKRYLVTIKVWTPQRTLRLRQLNCYGLDTIARVGHVVTSEHLEKFFSGVEPGELTRPESIDLLIGAGESPLAPNKLQEIGNLVLWDGPLGKTVSGRHPRLVEKQLTLLSTACVLVLLPDTLSLQANLQKEKKSSSGHFLP
ncbi:hypothetical protein JOB18_017835 [Solea senegalensis]|uniref:Uncharacterized protein n=1 Tax=Solea senegalensis TaxID=28829 RepID=A0AAV6Q9I1_SOLSE|nr:hypothetical protein JOB18_017835 [Solea senegalensis]